MGGGNAGASVGPVVCPVGTGRATSLGGGSAGASVGPLVCPAGTGTFETSGLGTLGVGTATGGTIIGGNRTAVVWSGSSLFDGERWAPPFPVFAGGRPL